MLKPRRFLAAAALVGALAVAGPAAGASAAQTGAASTPGSGIPCYPLPAFCASNGQPAVWAPWWVRPALGLPPLLPWQPITLVPLVSATQQ